MSQSDPGTGGLHPVTVVARVFDCSERNVQDLARRGVIPKARHGRYDLVACVQAYIRHLREVASGHTSQDRKLDLTQERAKLAIQQTEKLELENSIARGELIPKDEYLSSAGVVMSAVRTRVLSIGSKVQHAVAAKSEPRECRKVIEAEAREALEELSRLVMDSDGSGGE